MWQLENLKTPFCCHFQKHFTAVVFFIEKTSLVLSRFSGEVVHKQLIPPLWIYVAGLHQLDFDTEYLFPQSFEFTKTANILDGWIILFYPVQQNTFKSFSSKVFLEIEQKSTTKTSQPRSDPLNWPECVCNMEQWKCSMNPCFCFGFFHLVSSYNSYAFFSIYILTRNSRYWTLTYLVDYMYSSPWILVH